MGKKSRKKLERRLARMAADPSNLLRGMFAFHEQAHSEADKADPFHKSLEDTRDLLCQYNRVDLAIALCTSELWPPNTGSPVKHIFAWHILLKLKDDEHGRTPISSYDEFKQFAASLYNAWPEFPMLEDFSPEADWGQIKTRLDEAFVPMFYGSCVERTPDFVEAFRITYAHVPEALAQMDLAVAMQAHIIESISELSANTIYEAKKGYVEVPPENFWQACRSTIKQLSSNIGAWREKAGESLDVHFGTFDASLTWRTFGDDVMQGRALPFLVVRNDDYWIPMSVRSAPGLIIDHWANKEAIEVSSNTHQKLARFVAERFRRTVIGPLTLFVGNDACEDLPVSCIISNDSGVYLVCTCDHKSNDQISNAAKKVYSKVKSGLPIRFKLPDGRGLMLSKDGSTGPTAEELKILIVVTQGGTAFGTLSAPKKPVRLLPLADFITIFDSLDDLNELESYWKFSDSQWSSLSSFSTGHADLYASFRDTDGVLVDGAISPTFIGLDPHWGTSWRFKTLAAFWSLAPKVFPDGSLGWRMDRGSEGVVDLKSRHAKTLAYSTSFGCCTVQTLLDMPPDLEVDDARMLDLFAQLLADCTYRCREHMADIPLFQQAHVLFICKRDPSASVRANEAPQPLEAIEHVITSAKENAAHKGRFILHIDTRAILSGLNRAKDRSFDVRCLLETLAACYEASGSELPSSINDRLRDIATEPARYYLQVVDRVVDVPDFVEPILPSPFDYKTARKQLASKIMGIGLEPGCYELSEAKAKIDPASTQLRQHIENRISTFDRNALIKAFVEQHDACLITERSRVQYARQSLNHDVDFDRLEAVEDARKEFGTTARHYRYLLEKTVSTSITGSNEVTAEVLRELVGLVDWYKVLTEASDVLHHGIDICGVVIDEWYVPEIFYSTDSSEKGTEFAIEYAKSRLGVGVNDEDTVEGAAQDLMSSNELKNAFIADLGFELQNMVSALALLSQAQRYGLGNDLALSYAATPDKISQTLVNCFEELDLEGAERIVAFLTLSETGIRRLAKRNIDEIDVPFWEHSKRIHRYAIRPLVVDGGTLRWGAEAASRSMYNWMSAVRDGYLPADFDWPTVQPVIRKVKASIEKRLELQTEQIFRRHTPFVEGGIDFFRKFRKEGFEDVGDFDVFAYWPEANLLVSVECKYNQPFYTMKDGRRLRDKIFGKAEDDRAGQLSRILRRRQFLDKNRSRLLELLNWSQPETKPPKNVELYVSRDVYYWMIHPPYPVPTQFVRVDALDTWIKTELIT